MSPADFRSDNLAPVAPEFLSALAACNAEAAGATGRDRLAQEADRRFSALLGAPAHVIPVATGTAANALGLALAAGPGDAIACHEAAHIIVGFESGAVPFMTGGAALIGLAGGHGLIDPDGFARLVAAPPPGGGRWAALSLTQATEAGTLYTPAQIRALADAAHARGMVVHMDGARLAQAVAAGGGDAAAMTAAAGIDILSFGVTKVGGMSADAVVVFGPRREEQAALLHKRSGHTLAKRQFQLVQLLTAIEDGLWLRLGGHANALAARLGAGLAAVPGARLVHPVETNQVFVTLPDPVAARLTAAGHPIRIWQEPDEYRFVCAHHHTAAEVDALVACARA